MRKILHPSLTLGARKPKVSNAESTLARVKMVLHTVKGDVPWRPYLGCDISTLIGEAATPERINIIKKAVVRALEDWVPHAEVRGCTIQLINESSLVSHHREPGIPTAESALVAMGTQVKLEMKIDLNVEGEPIEVGTEVGI